MLEGDDKDGRVGGDDVGPELLDAAETLGEDLGELEGPVEGQGVASEEGVL